MEKPFEQILDTNEAKSTEITMETDSTQDSQPQNKEELERTQKAEKPTDKNESRSTEITMETDSTQDSQPQNKEDLERTQKAEKPTVDEKTCSKTENDNNRPPPVKIDNIPLLAFSVFILLYSICSIVIEEYYLRQKII